MHPAKVSDARRRLSSRRVGMVFLLSHRLKTTSRLALERNDASLGSAEAILTHSKNPPIISCRKGSANSNNLIHKGLAFLRNWSGTVLASRSAASALGSCPAGLSATAGLRWCGRMAALNRRRSQCSKHKQSVRPQRDQIDTIPAILVVPRPPSGARRQRGDRLGSGGKRLSGAAAVSKLKS